MSMPQSAVPQPPPAEPYFQVRVMKHTGIVLFWLNQYSTVTGTFAQCDAAIRQARDYCIGAGWWSLPSIVLWNWIALSHNSSARRTLYQEAQRAHEYAWWWATYYGTDQDRARVFPPPPALPQRPRWGLRILLIVVAIPVLLFVLLVVLGTIGKLIHHDKHSYGMGATTSLHTTESPGTICSTGSLSATP